MPSPWSRSQKRKGNRGINKDENRRIALFNSLDFLCEMGAWKILPEHSPGMSLVLLYTLANTFLKLIFKGQNDDTKFQKPKNMLKLRVKALAL